MNKKLSFSLTKVQENLLNIETLRENKELNNICAILDIPTDYSNTEIQEALNVMIKKIECLRIEILSSKTQKLSNYKKINELPTKYFKVYEECEKFKNEWRKESIFGFEKPLYQFILSETKNHKKQLFIKCHHLISDMKFIILFANTLAKLLLKEIQESDISGDFLLASTTTRKKTIDFWTKELDEFEGEALYKEKSDLLTTEEKKFDIPEKLCEAFQKSTFADELSFFEFYLSGLLFSKKMKTYSPETSVGIAISNHDGWHSNTKLLPFTKRIVLEQKIQDFLIDISEKHKKIQSFSDYTISEIIEEAEIDSFEKFTDISCMEIDQELGTDLLEKGFGFQIVNSGSRTNPLTIMCHNSSKKAYILYEYQKSSINFEQIMRLHEFVIQVLYQFIEKKDKTLQDVSLIHKYEEFYPTTKIENKESNDTILSLFEKQVAKFPEKEAVRYQGQGITFFELDEQSSNLASLFIDKGVVPEQVIATTLTGIRAIISILAILKAGAIYLPIDKEQPLERIKYILKDSLCSLLITDDENLAENLPINNIFFTDIVLTQQMNENVPLVSHGATIAYIIYTSGSTGVPKGVMIKHESVVNMCTAFTDVIDIEESDIIQQFASHSFDASILEIFGGILNGCTIVMVDVETKQDPISLQDLWDKEKVTFAIIPPVYMKNLDVQRETPLKYLMTAGEEANWNFVLPWKEKLTYINAYGPSEATVWTTTWIYEKSDNHTPVPIGRPIPNVNCYVFQDKQECGVEIPGELYISGTSLSVGYINNVNKNQESFSIHPRTGERIYRTGDIVYWDANKQLVFCGRRDSQVKIRGHRIELNELNDTLLRIEGVTEAYSCINEIDKADTEKGLVVYVVLDDSINKTSIREHVRVHLPTYMQPHHIVQIEKLPMTDAILKS